MRDLSSRPGMLRVVNERLVLIALTLAATAILTCLPNLGREAHAKTPGSTYCFYGKCQRVKSIAETEALVGTETTLSTSFYDDCRRDKLNPCGLTSSGEAFRPNEPDNAASPIYPDGTKLLVWSPETGAAAVIRVNNAGPYWGDRKLDVSRATAEHLGFSGAGVANLKVRILDAPTASEAQYQKNRKYDPVPGYIGQYASLEEAHAATAKVLAMEALADVVKAPGTREAVATARAGFVQANRETKLAAASDRMRKKRPDTRTASIDIPVIKEIVAFTEAVFGIKSPASSRSAGVKAASPAAPVLAAAEPRRAKTLTRTAAKAAPRAKRVAVASAARPAPKRAKPESVVADAPNDMSIFSRHRQPSGERFVSRSERRQAMSQGRPSRRPS